MKEIISQVSIESRIHLFRGKKVMIDSDLAALYEVETAQLKRAVRRNIDRFPEDFMFELNRDEYENLRCQFGTLRWGEHAKYLPFAFTEQGVAMLSSVLNSKLAIQVNIQIMRAFVRIRNLVAGDASLKKLIETHEKRLNIHDRLIQQAFDIVKKVLDPDPLQVKTEYSPKGKKMGFGKGKK